MNKQNPHKRPAFVRSPARSTGRSLWLTVLLFCAAMAAGTATLTVFSRPAEAFCCWRCARCPACPNIERAETVDLINEEHDTTRAFFGTVEPLPGGTGQLGEHQSFLINYLFKGEDRIGGILPAMMMMTEQMSAVAMQQMQIVGSFFDAKHQLETQQLMREKTARAHKAYQPSTGMCVIGTNVRSLAAAERAARQTGFILGQRLMDRQLGNANVNAADGPVEDREGRLSLFIEYFCDRNDNNRFQGQNASGLGLLCANAPPVTVNEDIDYTRAVELPRTLALDFDLAPQSPTNDEITIMEMASNLYAHDVFPRITKSELPIFANHDEFQDIRALVAKRSVAMNSFNNIVGLRAQGSGPGAPGTGDSRDTSEYMRVILRELGVEDERQYRHMLGDHGTTVGSGPTRPSYLAQMEILTKRIFQNPAFFTDLYDTPANVKRKSAALQALRLMLDRELHNSYLRNEMLMSILLEVKVAREQNSVESRLLVPVDAGQTTDGP